MPLTNINTYQIIARVREKFGMKTPERFTSKIVMSSKMAA